MGDKGNKSAAHPPEGSLVETRCLIKGPKSAIIPFAEPRSGPKSRKGSGASQKVESRELAPEMCSVCNVRVFTGFSARGNSTYSTSQLSLWFLKINIF